MEEKRRPIWPWIVGALGVLLLAGILFWKPVCLHVMSAMAEHEFRQIHRRDARAVTLIHEGDWAFSFGGSAGLHRLDRLIHDDSMTEDGRRTAAVIHGLIRERHHVFPPGNLGLPRQSWLMESMKAYIRERDSRP